MAWTFQKEGSIAKVVTAIGQVPAPTDPNEAIMVAAFKHFAQTDLASLALPASNNVLIVTAGGESNAETATMTIYFKSKFVDI